MAVLTADRLANHLAPHQVEATELDIQISIAHRSAFMANPTNLRKVVSHSTNQLSHKWSEYVANDEMP